MAQRMDSEYDFEDVRLMVVNTFAHINATTGGIARKKAVEDTARTQGVSENFVWKYALDAELNEGFFSPSIWGRGRTKK